MKLLTNPIFLKMALVLFASGFAFFMAAVMMRSGLSPTNTWRKPSPSAPMSRSASTCTLSKNSVYCFSGAVISTGITWA